MNESWSRLQKVIDWTGLSINKFAGQIGLLHAENLYRIKRGSNGISKELAYMISKRYAAISRAWLLTGEGAMMSVASPVPYYKANFSEIVEFGEIYSVPDDHLTLPFNENYTFAAHCNSPAMEPLIQQGSIVLFKKIFIDSIISGGVYLVCSAGISVIRRVKILSEGKKYLLVADKKSKFDPIELDATLLMSIYQVCGTINMIII